VVRPDRLVQLLRQRRQPFRFRQRRPSYISSIQAATETALADWGRYLQGAGSIDVRVEISDDLSFGTLAAAGPTSVSQVSSNVYLAGSLHELQTGTDLHGSTEDIIVFIDSFTLATGQYYFGSSAPRPTTSTL
jgi:hypothetical protein